MDELAFSPETLRLRSCHDQGRRHLSDVFWVRSEQGELLAVRQSVLLYEDAEKKELLGLAYARPVKEAAAGGELPAEEDTNERRRGAPRQSRQAGGIVMTMEECYQKLGGNYAEVSERLPSLRLVEKFVGRFPEDKSFETLCAAVEAGDREGAFRAAHTLKGVCANLSFTRLLHSASRLTEALRPEADAVSPAALPLLEEVRRDYHLTVRTIRAYMDGE